MRPIGATHLRPDHLSAYVEFNRATRQTLQPLLDPFMSIEDIRANFEFLDDWEDRYRYVIELGRGLPALDEALRTDANKVRGCASQVWLVSELIPAAPGSSPRIRFIGDSDAHIVRGLIAILLTALEGRTAREVEDMDLGSVFAGLGLKDHLTPQRSNGLAAMIQRVRSDASAAAEPATPRA